MRGLVAIVGRPNVGKSTLFNRLIRSRKSIVDDQPGVTRDRIYGVVAADDDGNGFGLIDTGGFETDKDNLQPFADNLVWQQSLQAIEEADLVILLLDGRHGLHPWDRHLAQDLKKRQVPVMYVVNKVDGQELLPECNEFYELGIENFYLISAAHSRGLDELLDGIREHLTTLQKLSLTKDYAPDAKRVALVGRPNVGKSSILNRLVASSRSLVSEHAGTTRDTVDTPFIYNQQNYVLLDTAGIRRRARIDEKLEGLSVMRSLQAVENADVVVLVIDAKEGFTDQDAKLASLCARRYKPLLLVINKWDLVEGKDANTAKRYQDSLRKAFDTLATAPMLFTSCLTNTRVHQIMSKVEMLCEVSQRRVETSRLNEALQTMIKEHTPAVMKARRKRIKFYYATQVRVAPPTFVIKCNLSDEIQDSYKRYISSRLQKSLGFTDVPIRVFFRGKGESKSVGERHNEAALKAENAANLN